MTQRTIQTILPANLIVDDGDMRLWRALPLPIARHWDPSCSLTTIGIAAGVASVIRRIPMPASR